MAVVAAMVIGTVFALAIELPAWQDENLGFIELMAWVLAGQAVGGAVALGVLMVLLEVV